MYLSLWRIYCMVESCVEFPSLATKVSQYFESTLEQIEAQKKIIDTFQYQGSCIFGFGSTNRRFSVDEPKEMAAKLGSCRPVWTGHAYFGLAPLQSTEVRFANFFSGGFITAIVVNPTGKETVKTHLCELA